MGNTVDTAHILSFDVSSVSTGWCYTKGAIIKKFGTIPIDKRCSIAKKLNLFRGGLKKIISKSKIDYVVVEDTYLRNVKTLKTLMMFIGVVVEFYYSKHGVEVVFVSPNSVRSYFGVKSKEEAFELVNNSYELSLTFEKDNDISDAILQGIYYYNRLKEIDNE